MEAANALWKKTARRELSSAEANRALDVIASSGLVIRPSRPLLARALVLAGRLAHPVYDCVYLALAEHERATLVTGDERLLASVAKKRIKIGVRDLRAV